MKHPLPPLLVTAALLLTGAPLRAELSLPSHFSHHAVFQRSPTTAIWGKGTPGEKISITLGSAQAEATVDEHGQWRTSLNLNEAEAGPHTLLVKGEKKSFTASNILIGDVWLASGQSNMAFQIKAGSDAESPEAQLEIPTLREFRPRVQAGPEPMDDMEGRWMVAKPPSNGNFSGVAYFFGKRLTETLKIPIGIINNSWSNTPIEPWIARQTLETDPILGEDAAKAREFFEQQPKDQTPPPLQARHVPGWIHNGMVAPLVGTTLRGFIWYQGESNANRAALYRKTFPLLIQSWRTEWGQGDLPFYFCQLAAYTAKIDDPNKASPWAELREAQAQTLALPQTGMAVLLDAGEELDIHPRDKRTPGERLAALALRDTYGKTLPAEGPRLLKAEVQGSEMILQFSTGEGGALVAQPLPESYRKKSLDEESVPLVLPRPGSALQGFAVCGADHHFHWADARIEGDRVIVSSPEVPTPVAVRYGWANNPTCNLTNAAGFPAAPFRTDALPLSTEGNRLVLPKIAPPKSN